MPLRDSKLRGLGFIECREGGRHDRDKPFRIRAQVWQTRARPLSSRPAEPTAPRPQSPAARIAAGRQLERAPASLPLPRQVQSPAQQALELN